MYITHMYTDFYFPSLWFLCNVGDQKVEPNTQTWLLVRFLEDDCIHCSVLPASFTWYISGLMSRAFSLFPGLDSSFWLLPLGGELTSNVPVNTGGITLSQASDLSPLPHISWHFSGPLSFHHPFNFKFLHSF